MRSVMRYEMGTTWGWWRRKFREMYDYIKIEVLPLHWHRTPGAETSLSISLLHHICIFHSFPCSTFHTASVLMAPNRPFHSATVYYLWNLTPGCWSDNGRLAVQYPPSPYGNKKEREMVVNHKTGLQPTASPVNMCRNTTGNENSRRKVKRKTNYFTIVPVSSSCLYTLGPKSFQASLPTSLLSNYTEIVILRCPLCIWIKSYLQNDEEVMMVMHFRENNIYPTMKFHFYNLFFLGGF